MYAAFKYYDVEHWAFRQPQIMVAELTVIQDSPTTSSERNNDSTDANAIPKKSQQYTIN